MQHYSITDDPLYRELLVRVDELGELTRRAERGEIEWTDPRIKRLREPILELTSGLNARLVIEIAKDKP